MRFEEAVATGLPLTWNNWAMYYRWDAAKGVLVGVNGGSILNTIPTHCLLGNLWNVEEPKVIKWYRAKLLWHRTGKYYRESRNWYPSITALEAALQETYGILEVETRDLPEVSAPISDLAKK